MIREGTISPLGFEFCVCLCICICMSVCLQNAGESIKHPVSSAFLMLRVNDSPLRKDSSAVPCAPSAGAIDREVRLC